MKVISKPFWRRRRVSMFGTLLSRKGQFEAGFRDGAKPGVHELVCFLIRLCIPIELAQFLSPFCYAVTGLVPHLVVVNAGFLKKRIVTS